MKHPRGFWLELMGEVEAGATVAEVARRHHVKPGTLTWWRWRLGREPRMLPVLTRVEARPSIASARIELFTATCR
ncbi:MAG: transposase [Polyangiaceae bacterium]